MGSLKKNRKKRPGSGLQKHKRSIVAITAVIILLCGMVIVHGMALKKSNDAYKVQEEELQTVEIIENAEPEPTKTPLPAATQAPTEEKQTVDWKTGIISGLGLAAIIGALLFLTRRKR